MEEENIGPRRKPGRPAGSKNRLPPPRQPIDLARLVPPANADIRDYRHADPVALIDRQFAIIDWAQQALRNEVTAQGFANKGESIDSGSIKKIMDLSNALARNIEALKKHQDMAEELAKRMTPEDLLEAALKKLEGQDLRILNYAIKRLRAYRETMAPVNGVERMAIGYEEKATDAIASLESE
jgi:hypothetical protein